MMEKDVRMNSEESAIISGLLDRHLPSVPAWVYGPRVKQTSIETSDLDLVVFATPDQRYLIHDLREAFKESNLLFRVVLFIWDNLPQAFKKQIKSQYVALN